MVGLSRRSVDFGDSRYHDVDVDLGDVAALRDAADRHILPAIGRREWNRIGLVNNAAATGTMAPLEDVDPEGFAGVLAVNLVAPVFLMGMVVRAAPAATRRSGSSTSRRAPPCRRFPASANMAAARPRCAWRA